MNNADLTFIGIVGGPARFDVEQVALKLNFRVHDIPILVAEKLLKPLGNPPPSGVKYFAAVEVMEFASDPVWLGKATNAIYKHWKKQNSRKKGEEGSLVKAA